MDDRVNFPVKNAAEDFFKVHHINPAIVKIDGTSVYFQKTKQVTVQYW
jgi:hypothetical protein